MLYNIALFIHIIGVLGIFAFITLELGRLFSLRSAWQMEEVRAWASTYKVIVRALPLAVLLTLCAGLFMAWQAWGWDVPWIDVGFFAFITIGMLGRLSINRHQKLNQAIEEASSGPLPAELLPMLNDPVLWSSALMMTVIALGVVFLMTVKPDLLGSLIGIAVAIIAGLLAIIVQRNARQREKQPEQKVHE